MELEGHKGWVMEAKDTQSSRRGGRVVEEEVDEERNKGEKTSSCCMARQHLMPVSTETGRLFNSTLKTLDIWAQVGSC